MPAERSVLITGCSTGFGRVTAMTLARAKCRVFAGMRDIRGRNAANAARRPGEGGKSNRCRSAWWNWT